MGLALLATRVDANPPRHAAVTEGPTWAYKGMQFGYQTSQHPAALACQGLQHGAWTILKLPRLAQHLSKGAARQLLNGNETDCPLQLVFTFTLLFSCSKAIAISLQEHDLLRKAIWYVKINRETVINLPNMQTCLPWTFGQNVMLLNCMV